uniref:ribosomal maturation YjgA family protein n=1 Tax=Thaumasiovibrio occultus TaxID=1891184 RepID=UPI000B355C42|nr:DUF2809 domain-containing protein [Thaumasiovibrio occultus]
MFTFRPRYAITTVVLFALLVFIALYVRDSIIRPFGGDILVVIWLYCGGRAILTWAQRTVALAVLLFAYSVEIAQALKITEVLGLVQGSAAQIAIGSTFDWWDMLAYTLGVSVIYLIDRQLPASQPNS